MRLFGGTIRDVVLTRDVGNGTIVGGVTSGVLQGYLGACELTWTIDALSFLLLSGKVIHRDEGMEPTGRIQRVPIGVAGDRVSKMIWGIGMKPGKRACVDKSQRKRSALTSWTRRKALAWSSRNQRRWRGSNLT